jgi:hypothetical protein
VVFRWRWTVGFNRYGWQRHGAGRKEEDAFHIEIETQYRKGRREVNALSRSISEVAFTAGAVPQGVGDAGE